MARKSFAKIPDMDQFTKRRFLEKIDIRAPQDCWLWKCAKTQGYGRFKIGRKLYLAHRISYRLFCEGPMPRGKVVMHSCDNPACCNPHHLKLGSYYENVADMDAKNRRNQSRGEAAGTAKLTEDAVLAIRSSNLSERKLAEIHGVSKSNIHMIRARESWQHV